MSPGRIEAATQREIEAAKALVKAEARVAVDAAEAKAEAAEARAVAAEAKAKAAEVKAAEAPSAATAEVESSILEVRAKLMPIETEDGHLSEQLAGAIHDGERVAKQLLSASRDLKETHAAAKEEFEKEKERVKAAGLAAEEKVKELTAELSAVKQEAATAASKAKLEVSRQEAKVKALQDELQSTVSRAQDAQRSEVSRIATEKNEALLRERRATQQESERADSLEASLKKATEEVEALRPKSIDSSAAPIYTESELKAAEEKVEERIRMEMVSSAKERMDGIEEKTSKLEGRLKDAQEEAKVSGERVNELTTLNDLAAGREAKLIEKVAELERRIAELSGEAPMDVPGSAPARAPPPLPSLQTLSSGGNLSSVGQLSSGGPSGPLSAPRPRTIAMAPAIEAAPSSAMGAPGRPRSFLCGGVPLSQAATTARTATDVSAALGASGGAGDLQPLSEDDLEVETLSPGLPSGDQLDLPPDPPKAAKPASPPKAPTLKVDLSSVAASGSAEKLPSPHRRDDAFYKERAMEIKAQRSRAEAEARAAAPASPGQGMQDDDALSLGSVSGDDLDAW